MQTRPDLSIIVPVLDEAATLPDLFGTLSLQEGTDLELLLCDGGSRDGTPARAAALAGHVPFPCTVVHSGRGRGRQMNAGAAAARAETFLFLHADSLLADRFALRHATTALWARGCERGDDRVAGRFSLRFRRSSAKPSLAYYFYECKARLDRAGCIHGDQGLLLRRSFFDQVGPFDEALPLFEDDRIADRIRSAGEWLLLSPEIITSARRFEVEGLRRRQTLNALLMNFAAIGWDDFFADAGNLYRQQSRTERLDLYPFFAAIDRSLRELHWRRRLQLWYRTGAFVRDNGWQLAFACDVRRSFRAGRPPGAAPAPALAFFDRVIDPLTGNAAGRLAAAALTWCWFQVSRRRLRRRCTNKAEKGVDNDARKR